MASSQDTEITLGTGKMLVLFFGLVILCAVFFGMGFSLGHSTAKPMAELQSPASSSATVRQAAVKPASNTGTQDLTFYKAVEQKDSDTQTPAPQTAAPSPAPADSTPTPAPTAPEAVQQPVLNGYYVQVAAVTKAEDAQALVDALKKKQYPAAANNNPGDNLYHVQLGPFGDVKEAEAMRARLVADGYNPNLKR